MFIAEIPPYYHPLQPAIHPMADKIDERAISWMRTFNLGLNAKERDRMTHCRIGQLVSRMVPSGQLEPMQVFADFLMWVFTFDDEYCDEGPLGSRPGELADAVSGMLRAFDSPGCPIVSPADRYSHALRDLRRRLDLCAAPSQIEHLSRTLTGYLLSEVRKAGYVATSRPPKSLDSYIPMRMQNGGALAIIAFPAIAEGYDFPLSLLQSDRVRAITEMCVTISNYDADIFSYSKERARSGDGFNIIDVICREYECEEKAAFAAAKSMRDRIMTLFLRILEHGPSQESPELSRYMAGLNRYMRGVIDWHFETERYMYLDGIQADSKIVQPAGWDDALDDPSHEPLPFSSVSWWWRYDPCECRRVTT
ncbi:terpene synthase family protein [Streptomyces sp. NPDC002306]